MKHQTPWRLVAMVFVVALVLNIPRRDTLTAYVPALIFASQALAWVVPRPGRWLMAVSVWAELLSVYPAGLLTGAVWLPYLLRHLAPKTEVDISARFALAVSLTVLAQSSWLALVPHLFDQPADLLALWAVVPWRDVITTSALSAAALSVTCVALRYTWLSRALDERL